MTYNELYTLAVHYGDIAERVITAIVSVASAFAAFTPAKKVVMPNVHKAIDFFALNIFHAKDHSKAVAAQTIVPPLSGI